MSVQQEWVGSPDPEIESGLGTFRTHGGTLTLKLESFKAFQAIGQMLDVAYAAGKAHALKQAADQLRRMQEAL